MPATKPQSIKSVSIKTKFFLGESLEINSEKLEHRTQVLESQPLKKSKEKTLKKAAVEKKRKDAVLQ
ncbi:hypothetical protein J23TS9_18190 [Paenibacillus sp. J23TS9]|nr:hypothetical protein J23TS9_18190 [Paenibacillus sp. J23TS9]